MDKAGAAHYDLARYLLAEEGSTSERPAGLLAGERVCNKLREGLSTILSPAGFHALLSRALRLAQQKYPFLQGIRVTESACLAGLDESTADQDPACLHEALVALLANLYCLLASFIGDDLAQRQIRRIWPGLPLGEARPADKETVR